MDAGHAITLNHLYSHVMSHDLLAYKQPTTRYSSFPPFLSLILSTMQPIPSITTQLIASEVCADDPILNDQLARGQIEQMVVNVLNELVSDVEQLHLLQLWSICSILTRLAF